MTMANAYDAFASAYDALNSDADYTAMADHIDKVFARSNIPRSSLVLDLGCGTGMLTRELDARGYDMTGVDSSEEMLGKAYENSAQSAKILYLCQDITEFELYGTVAAAVCTTDTLNHLTDDASVEKVFSLLHNYLDPGGIFIFDVNSEYKFSSVYGQKSIEKSGDMPDFFLYSQSAAAGIFPAAAVTLSYSARKKPCVFYICV